MSTFSLAIASAGWLVACSACAQAVLDDAAGVESGSERSHGYALAGDSALSRSRFTNQDSSYNLPLGRHGTLSGYIGLPGEPALGPPLSTMRRFAGIDNPDSSMGSHWLDSSANVSRVFTVGYAWRGLKVEGSAFSQRAQSETAADRSRELHLDSKSTRLSYKPSSNWSLQVSRGTLIGLDQVVPNGDVRRATISATYDRQFEGGNWQSTFAWGRNVRKYREPTTGYLMESTLRFSGTHAVFGRLEQVGSDELLRDSDPSQRLFKMNKLTVGYFHDVQTRGAINFDVGALVSKNFVPSAQAPAYGSEPTAYMMFIRLKLQ